jgi:hypothetical protein
MAASHGPQTEISSLPEFRVSPPVDTLTLRNPSDTPTFAATINHPVLALVNVVAWVWLALSVFRWIEHFAGIIGASLRNALRF